MNEAYEKRPWPVNGWILALLVGFVVMLIANGTMIYLAMDSWTGVTEEHHYERGLAYNREVEAYHRQLALGWNGQVDSSSRLAASQAGEIGVTLKDRAGRPVTGVRAEGDLFRSMPAGHDQPLQFVEREPGIYRAAVTPPLPGAWDVRVQFTRGNDSYRLEQRIQVPATAGGK
jgi:nitrogen fixation protein FixH